jgi:hypothetical protein
LPALLQLVIFYVMMPLAFWDSTRNGLSRLLKVADIMLYLSHEPA